ncbi:hypothetical protein [Aphanothece sacrum]|uniref:Uncharacterized protein n=1 Tax=Aphanothece sacrum FPU1 TaxID=1920663 RepID=A0A401IJF8_APHSA|nr:hypothetical protein [Aphanothece sacrum]GBF81241.1 hypothetical protein AsFPU1_2653 [Aphanothece sacrum FPU1]GBF83409.1 hypothetical protein AsFPU3_0451 [Aphanothece sacrum FPU3]
MEVKGGLFDILAKIKARPGLYIGRPSVSNLFMFLVGYKTARKELEIEATVEEMRFYQEFHQFVEKKYNLHTSNTWAKIILLYCPDEKQGFEHFFELLEEFQKPHSHEIHANDVEDKEVIMNRYNKNFITSQ